jgi:cytochrome c oxidase cbb3-type subunit 3
LKPGNRSTDFILLGIFLGCLYLVENQVVAQNPTAPQAPTANAAGGAAPVAQPRAYPIHPKAPQDVLNRGKATFGVSCAFCHGSDARGGEVGPNLMRSAVVLEDQNGELIAPIVHGGRAAQGMPRVDITDAQILDVAAWLHDFNPIGKGVQFNEVINIVTGDAKAGEVYFKKTCGSCHSATGDLAGIGSRIATPKTLQQTWLLPGGGGRAPGAYSAAQLGLHIPPATVTVTLANGKKVTGNLVDVSDFYVGLTTADGGLQGFRRDGDSPKVELHDPIAAHRELIQKYTDKDIHNVTAYLVTLK